VTAPADTAAANLRAVTAEHIADGRLDAPRYAEADVTAVLDERERLAARIAELEAELANVLRADGSADYSSGGCDGCGCCTHEGCHRFAGATCPTDSLGDSACPCTED
jgi:hypothetical protein